MNTKEIEKQLKQSLKKDFDGLYAKEFTTRWREERFVRGMELDIMSLENTAKLISTLRQSDLEEVREKMPKKKMEDFDFVNQSVSKYNKEGEDKWGDNFTVKNNIAVYGFNEYHDQVTSLINNLIEEK